METSLKTGFAQILLLPQNLSCPKFGGGVGGGGAAAHLAPPARTPLHRDMITP